MVASVAGCCLESGTQGGVYEWCYWHLWDCLIQSAGCLGCPECLRTRLPNDLGLGREMEFEQIGQVIHGLMVRVLTDFVH